MYHVFFYFFMNTTQLMTIFKNGLRRRCAPRNDGGVGARLTVITGVAQD